MSCSYPCRKPCNNPVSLGNRMCNFHIRHISKKKEQRLVRKCKFHITHAPKPVIPPSDQHEHKEFKEECCAVCTDGFEANFTPLNPCGHYIHTECVVSSGKAVCPICRTKVILSEEDKKKTNEVNENLRRVNDEEYERQIRNQYENEESERHNNNNLMSNRTSPYQLLGTHQLIRNYRPYRGVLHRDGDLPALIYNKEYYVNGRLQREERWDNGVLEDSRIYF